MFKLLFITSSLYCYWSSLSLTNVNCPVIIYYSITKLLWSITVTCPVLHLCQCVDVSPVCLSFHGIESEM